MDDAGIDSSVRERETKKNSYIESRHIGYRKIWSWERTKRLHYHNIGSNFSCGPTSVAGYNVSPRRVLTLIYVLASEVRPWDYPWGVRKCAAEWVHGREEGRICREVTKVAKCASNLPYSPQ